MPDLKTGCRLVRCTSPDKDAKVFYLELSEKPGLADYQLRLEKGARWQRSENACEQLPTAFADWLTLENFNLNSLERIALRRILNNDGFLTLIFSEGDISGSISEFLQNIRLSFVQSIELKDGRRGFLYKQQQIICCGTITLK